MTRPTFSVLINNFNYGRFVAQAVQSALAQTETDAEVIVVDDGSTDDSRAVLAPFGDRVRLIFRANGGQAAAINEAVHASRGQVLAFLDADDWWAPEKLACVAAAFRGSARLAMVYHRLQPIEDGRLALKPIPRTLCRGDLSRRLTRSAGWWPFPMTSAIAVRRSAWDRAGDIPELFRLSADAWLAGVQPFVGDVVGLPQSLGFYRLHSNGWYRASDDAAMLRRRMAHWQASVGAINAYLEAQGAPERLDLADHLPYRLAAAQLGAAGAADRTALARAALSFAGEPNLLRRIRNAWRIARDLRPAAAPANMREAAP